MRTLAITALAMVFTALPVFAAASTLRPPMDANKCPANSSTEASASQNKSFGFAADPTKMKNWIDAAVACPNACYDLGVAITLTAVGFDAQVNAANKCLDQTLSPEDIRQNPARGCAKTDQQPQVSISVTRSKDASQAVQFSDKNVTKSRCNMDAVEGALNSVGSNASSLNSSPESTAQINSALQNLQNAPSTSVSSQLPGGVQKVLNGAFDLSTTDGQQQAQQALENSGMSSSDAQDAISKLANGSDASSVAAGQQEIASKLNLNKSLFDVGSVQPGSNQIDPTQTGSMQNSGPASSSTFNNGQPGNSSQNGSSLPTECGINGQGGNIIYAESHCGRNTYQPLSSVQGPGQFLCSTWNGYTQSTGNGQYSCSCNGTHYASSCSSVNDIQTVATVLNAKDVQFQQQYGSECAAAGQTWSSCSYAIHVFGEGNFQKILNAEVSNPSASAYSVCSSLGNNVCSNNNSIFRDGGTLNGLFANLDQRQGSGTAGTSANAIATNIPISNGTGYLPVSSSFSPFNFTGSAYATPLIGATGSPYANMYTYPTTYGTTNQTSPIFSFLTGLVSSLSAGLTTQQPAANTVQETNQQTNVQTGPPTISLVVQPASTTRGTPIQVSWITSGMSSNVPCRLLLDTSVVNSNNVGLQQVATKNLALGNHTFTLQCTDTAGTVRVSSSTVTIN